MENKYVLELPVGLHYRDEVHKEVELLKTNGVAEKIIRQKSPDKPYTWQANVLCAAVKRIGPFEIGVKVREDYLKTQTVTIPEAVRRLTMADMNTLMVEIHRRVWKSAEIKAQELICMRCTSLLKGDIDLNLIDFSDEDKAFMATDPDLTKIVVYLTDGFMLEDTMLREMENFKDYRGAMFNKIVYTPPLVSHAIDNEKYSKDETEMWRHIAVSCTMQIAAVENPGKTEETEIFTLPELGAKILGQKLYDMVLSTEDLGRVREELQEYLPTLPFVYYAPCGCEKKYSIPWAMEATNFF